MRSIKTSIVPVCVLISALAIGCKSESTKEGEEGAKEGETKTTAGEPAAASAFSPQTQAFVTQAAQENAFEVQAGQMVLDSSTSDAVKQLAAVIIDEHRKANDSLGKLAREHGMEIPTELAPQDASAKDELAKKAGKELDDTYVEMVLAHHQQFIDMYEAQAKRTEDPGVGSWASQTLPLLRRHFDQAQSVKEGLGAQAALDNPSTPEQ